MTLNIEFFDAWTHDDTAPLATILSHASRLQSLTFQASNSPYDTPWNRLNVQDDSLRGISLGLEGLPVDSLPIFDRLTHLELQTLSTCNLEILLSRAPNLSSLAITLPDGLSEAEIAALLSSLRHVPKLKELTVSVADWEPCTGSNETALVGEVLRVIAQRLPSLEILDLRTKSYDMVDGILSYTCVQLDWLSFEVCGLKLFDGRLFPDCLSLSSRFTGLCPDHPSFLKPPCFAPPTSKPKTRRHRCMQGHC